MTLRDWPFFPHLPHKSGIIARFSSGFELFSTVTVFLRQMSQNPRFAKKNEGFALKYAVVVPKTVICEEYSSVTRISISVLITEPNYPLLGLIINSHKSSACQGCLAKRSVASAPLRGCGLDRAGRSCGKASLSQAKGL